jgi:TRAP-type C4-dicarboxylate transport system permease small subunit
VKLIQAFDDILEKFSRWGLVSTLLTILGLAVIAIVLRWCGKSLMWIEPLTRHLVFLCAFLGGSLATSKDVHIKVDLLTKLIEKSRSVIVHWLHKNLISLFCLIVVLGLLKSSWDFYLSEKEFGNPSLLGLHSSTLVAIIPFGFGLITLRFFNQLILGILKGDPRGRTHV